MSDESILLKFGSLKDWMQVSPDNKIFHQTLEEYFAERFCDSLAFHKNTPKQKEILCRLIDGFEGKIYLDGGDGPLTQEEAKVYINNHQGIKS